MREWPLGQYLWGLEVKSGIEKMERVKGIEPSFRIYWRFGGYFGAL